jgi:histidyl-tRNA synthetase
MVRIQASKGTEDLLPERIPAFEHLYGACRDVFARYGYAEIRTPLLEETALFVRSLGEATDVVEKEMFTVARGDTSVTFRPEGTAGVVRAYLEHHFDKQQTFQKFFYIGPMFRFERPQAGRMRQFDQVGIEVLGSYSPLLDAEAIVVAQRCFEAAGLRNFQTHLNSIGDRADRERFRAVLKQYMASVLPQRCADCQQRFQRNVFRMLDCKVPGCQPSNRDAPRFLDHLTAESRAHFDRVRAALAKLEIPHVVDPAIVRGFDYYTHTVFEVRCPDVGARDAICGGGRYDDLVADIGGAPQGAVGFAIGVTPTLLALEKQGHGSSKSRAPALEVFVAPVSEGEREVAFLLCERLRRAGLGCDTDYEGRSLKGQFRAADKRGVRLLLMLGPDEVRSQTVKVKDFQSKEEFTAKDGDDLAATLRERLARR